MVGPTPGSTNQHLSSYYESLRSNVMSILGQVKVPQGSSNEMMEVSGGFNPSKENFDSYLTKLQTICTETMSNEEVKPIQHHLNPYTTSMGNLNHGHPASVNTTSVQPGTISAAHIGHGANNTTMPTSI